MRGKKLLGLAVFLVNASSAQAGRTMSIVPIETFTIAGGRNSTGVGCTSADVDTYTDISLTKIGTEGVAQIIQGWVFTFKNLGGPAPTGLPQIISPRIQIGTNVLAKHGTGTPNVLVAEELTVSALTESTKRNRPGLPLAADGILKYTVVARCGRDHCSLIDDSGLILGTLDPAADAGGAGVQVNCLQLQATLAVSFGVTDSERGSRVAIQGQVMTFAHRNYGLKDKNIMPPSTFQINGGRAF